MVFCHGVNHYHGLGAQISDLRGNNHDSGLSLELYTLSLFEIADLWTDTVDEVMPRNTCPTDLPRSAASGRTISAHHRHCLCTWSCTAPDPASPSGRSLIT